MPKVIALAQALVVTMLTTIAGCATLDATLHPSLAHATAQKFQPEIAARIVISIHDQKLVLLRGYTIAGSYSISTSRHGVGEVIDSGRTPRGIHAVAEKIGAGAALGIVFKDRVPTEEVVAVDTPDRSPITTRILHLKGLQEKNISTFERFIYVHGSPAENTLGSPQSGGCIKLSATDIVRIFDEVDVNTEVLIYEEPIDAAIKLVREMDLRLVALTNLAESGALEPIRKLCVGAVFGTDGFSMNDSVAMRWCTAGALQQDALTITMIGELHERGRGFVQNMSEARRAYEAGFKLGNPHALYKLALMYKDGIGGAKYESFARDYFERLAKQGHSGAKKVLADGF